MEKTRYLLLQALASMAWADDYLDNHERDLLKELFEEDQLDPQVARSWLTGPVEFPDLHDLKGILPDSSDRLDLLTQLLHVALTDRWLHPGEVSLMRQLGQAFGMGEEILDEFDHYAL